MEDVESSWGQALGSLDSEKWREVEMTGGANASSKCAERRDMDCPFYSVEQTLMKLSHDVVSHVVSRRP